MTTIQCADQTFENIQAVLFDKDGTLADSESFLKSLGQKRSRLVDAQIPGVQEPLLMAFGLEADQINAAGLLAVGSRRENEIAAAAYVAETGRDWLEALEVARSGFAEADGFLNRKADHTPLVAGGLALLQALAAAKLKVGILSADTTDNVADFIQKHQLDAYVQAAIGVDGSVFKPDPALFHQACNALGTAPETTLMIGDSAADIEMARAAGAAGCIGVTGGWTMAPKLANADVVSQLEHIQVLS